MTVIQANVQPDRKPRASARKREDMFMKNTPESQIVANGQPVPAKKAWVTPQLEEFEGRPEAAFSPFPLDDTTLRSS
jgi:hypothetical protein